MKKLLQFVIKFYQKHFSKKLARNCLFKESCSNYVYRKLEEEGTKKGLKAFYYRFQTCRVGYTFSFNTANNNFDIILENGDVLLNSEISESIELPNFSLEDYLK
ncbi:membrane protein insertion efficiency factor YidD [Bernardetia sp. MNP-M8]|uniref:membrane protein insertion efficiency factor YidD n=1 Tax=Bernardetia sp. MNP-M8 TaxID=3127470 RepID=UPI0030D590E1